MELARTCKICETPFVAIKTTQYFCRRKCFKRDYYLRNKEKQSEATSNPTFPKKTCGYCGNMQMIPYDPVKSPEKFNKWECVTCGVTNELLWRHENNPSSYQIITEILKSVQMSPFRFPESSTVTVRATFIIVGESAPETREIPKPHQKKMQQQHISSVIA